MTTQDWTSIHLPGAGPGRRRRPCRGWWCWWPGPTCWPGLGAWQLLTGPATGWVAALPSAQPGASPAVQLPGHRVHRYQLPAHCTSAPNLHSAPLPSYLMRTQLCSFLPSLPHLTVSHKLTCCTYTSLLCLRLCPQCPCVLAIKSLKHCVCL